MNAKFDALCFVLLINTSLYPLGHLNSPGFKGG